MTWATAVDRLNANVRDTFPAAAVHTPVGGVAQAVTVVHDYRWLEVVATDGQAVSAQTHTAFVRLADFATSPRQGDTLAIGSVTYEVTDVQVDGQGGATLILMVSVGGMMVGP